MVLHAERGMLPMPYTGNRIVIQVAVSNFQVRRKVFFLHGKPVILGGDFHSPGVDIQYGLIGPPMPEFELEGLGTWFGRLCGDVIY